jgi:hypothetical protein
MINDNIFLIFNNIIFEYFKNSLLRNITSNRIVAKTNNYILSDL